MKIQIACIYTFSKIKCSTGTQHFICTLLSTVFTYIDVRSEGNVSFFEKLIEFTGCQWKIPAGSAKPAGIGKFLKFGSQEDGSSVLWKGLEMLTSCPMIDMASTFLRSIVESR